DPVKMFTQKVDPELVLMDLLRSKQNAVIGQHYFDEFINQDPTKIRFNEIEQKMKDAIASIASENYGITIESVGIKQLKVSEENTTKAFEQMRAERNSRATAIRTEGQSLAKRITSDADAKRVELLAAAEARAKQIRGQGDAEAARYYRLLEADPQFAMFLRDIEALRKMLGDRTTIVFSTDVEPLNLLRGIPEISPKPE
ncbi:MAG TPA: SPFH domain-containing protein, partial [Sedimentisphaerales bacterium]|nr:SPFH domain-containing protein [Sedimentisphaerales bacterium]